MNYAVWGFIIFCLLVFWNFYKKNYLDNQNKQIIDLLKAKKAKKYENILCSISIGLSITIEQFDVYTTNDSIVLIRSYANYIGNTQLKKRAETYLIIFKEEGFPIPLFTNYIRILSVEKSTDLVLIGDLYSKNSLFSKEFLYSLEAKIKIPGINIGN